MCVVAEEAEREGDVFLFLFFETRYIPKLKKKNSKTKMVVPSFLRMSLLPSKQLKHLRKTKKLKE